MGELVQIAVKPVLSVLTRKLPNKNLSTVESNLNSNSTQILNCIACEQANNRITWEMSKCALDHVEVGLTYVFFLFL